MKVFSLCMFIAVPYMLGVSSAMAQFNIKKTVSGTAV